MGLDGDPIGIDLGALPCLEYLTLAEGPLTRVPPQVRACERLVSLDLRSNRLESIEHDELPRSLCWLNVAKNRLPRGAIDRLRKALPDCHVEIY